jgi:hypothetical protein
MTTRQAAKQLTAYLEPLTETQRIWVTCKLKGMTDVAAATAAGIANPKTNGGQFRKSAACMEALKAGVEILANDVMFTRKQAHEMYMDAHRNAANSLEQVAAINAMVKLHGIAAPEVKEIHQHVSGSVEHREVRELTDEQLLQLAKLPDSQMPQIIDGEYDIVEPERQARKA